MSDEGIYVGTFGWTVDLARDGDSKREVTEDVVVSALMGDLRTQRLGRYFPTRIQGVRFADLPIGVRMHNVLDREGLETFGEIAEMSVEDVLGLRSAGVGSVREFLSALVRHAVFTSQSGEEAPIAAIAIDEAPGWHRDVRDHIETLARWHRLLGQEETSVFFEPEGISEPPSVTRARARLAALSASTTLSPIDGEGAAAALVDDALHALDERQLEVVKARVFADQPTTLDALGDRFDVTRERIRQVETKAIRTLTERMQRGDLHVLAAVVRDAIGELTTVRTLVQRYPTVAERVEKVGQPVWRILDRLDDAYEIKDGWCASGSIAAAVARTKSQLAGAAAGRAFVELQSVDADEAGLSLEWLDYCGVVVLEGCAFIGRPSIQDRAEVVLHTRQEQMDSESILARIGVERSLNSLKNQLSEDDRFTRVDRDTWALSRWGMTGYIGIRAMIGRALDTAAGTLPLNELVDVLTSRYDVTARSVMAYAAVYPYITKGGIVRRRGRRDMRRARRKNLAQTRALYRHDGSVKLRFVVNSEHLRGSGSTLPNAIGEEIDLSVSEARDIPLVTGGSILVSWRGPQITLGSVRSEIERLGLSVGDVAFFVFRDDSTFEVERCAPATAGRDLLVAMTGGPITNGEDLFDAIAERIDLQDASKAAVVAALSSRGDSGLVEVIAEMEHEASPTAETGFDPSPADDGDFAPAV